MTSLRILLLSNTRPSRAWRFARRVTSDIPGVEVCGIVQKAFAELPVLQQAIAAGQIVFPESAGLWARVKRWWDAGVGALVHAVLWVVHGCPLRGSRKRQFAVKELFEHCSMAGCAFLQSKDLGDSKTAEFIDQKWPDLVVVLGEVACLPPVSAKPSCGWLRIRSNEVCADVQTVETGLHLRIEHIVGTTMQTLGSLTLRYQPRDGQLGTVLKSDLIADDVLEQAVAGIRVVGPGQVPKGVANWIEGILSPYLTQLGPSPTTFNASAQPRRWLRSFWSLSAETILLFSPLIAGRNWVRRLRRRHPVLILAHHLVSDRHHRMAISTEEFWRQIRFLQRHYRVVRLSEAATILQSGRVKEPLVALTFDDGYADNFISLRAVAEEMDIPVSLFITTQPVTLRTEFQHDVIRGDHGAFAMTWDQIRYWKRRGSAEFGAHTRTHVKCGFVDRAVLVQEIVDSKADFKSELGAVPEFFAFPYGNPANMPAHAIALAMQAYPYYLSCHGGENLPGTPAGNAHLFRKSAYTEPWELELELQSVFDLVRTMKSALGISIMAPAPPQESAIRPLDMAPLDPRIDFEKTAPPLAADSSLSKQR